MTELLNNYAKITKITYYFKLYQNKKVIKAQPIKAKDEKRLSRKKKIKEDFK